MSDIPYKSVCRSFLVESSLTYSSVVMMLFTLAYISSSYSEVKSNRSRKRRRGGRKKADVEVEDNNANAVTEQFKVAGQKDTYGYSRQVTYLTLNTSF